MRNKSGTVWSGERRRTQSERMRQVWAQRKANLSRQFQGLLQGPYVIIIISITITL